MENEITKLSNVKYIVTEEVMERKWQDVISKRNSLLAISDWTQLLDCELPQSSKGTWLKWRKKVRNIGRKTVTEPDNALHLLKALENQMPKRLIADLAGNENNTAPTLTESNVQEFISTYVDDNVIPKIINVEDIVVIVKDNIANIENEKSAPEPIVLSSNLEDAKREAKHFIDCKCNMKLPIINRLLIDEALDFLVGSSTVTKMLALYAKYYNKSLEDTAGDILFKQKEDYKTSCNIEEKRLSYFVKIDTSNTVDEVRDISKEFMNGY